MTAVLQATDALRKDRAMASLDDSQINYSSSTTDWKAKYHEVADMLAETRAELDDFQHSSKELEEELERELERTEKVQQDLRVKAAKAETERDEWKGKFMSLQTTYNTTTASLQRELDTLRQEHQKIKVQLRDLEMGNDDLERNERAVTSTLADMESKYARVLEEKILLEHELLDKANLEEDCQRLKDELRDANAEISVIKDQLVAHQAAQSTTSVSTSDPADSAQSFPKLPIASSDNLLTTPPPANMQQVDLSPTDSLDESPLVSPTTRLRPMLPPITTVKVGQSTLLQRAGFHAGKNDSDGVLTVDSPMSRSATLPTPTRVPPRKLVTRPPVARNASTASTSTSTSVPGSSKSRGVQMVSEMRARVRNLEQKIHTRVPRLRMGSMTGKSNANALAASTIASPSTTTSIPRSGLTRFNVSPERSTNLTVTRHSADDALNKKRGSGSDTSGWVLIMEDSPSPVKNKDKQRRRGSSPSPASNSRSDVAASSSSPTLSSTRSSPLNQSTVNTGNRRSQSRLSGASLSTTATISSIPTPSSRPATPTFLPLPSSGLYAHASTAGATGIKRTPGPPSSYSQVKRSSLGSGTAAGSMSDGESRSKLYASALPPRPASGTPSSTSSISSRFDNVKGLTQIPGLHSNVTMRSSKLPTSSSVLSQSRIGRPSGGVRRSDASEPAALESLLNVSKAEQGRARSGSTMSRNRF